MASPMIRVGMVSATAALIALFCSCTTSPSATDTMTMTQGKTEMKIDKASFGKLPDGREADLYTLTNANGLQTAITNYGAIVVSLHAPDRDGRLADIVLGYPKLADYLKDTPYFGAIVGRYGNRIAKGRFTLDGVEHTLATNDGANHLHGGKIGFCDPAAGPITRPAEPRQKIQIAPRAFHARQGVADQQAARPHGRREALEGRPVHADEHVGRGRVR